MTKAHLHGGPLDGAVRSLTGPQDGEPPETKDFEYTDGGATWYAQYRRTRQDDKGWHYEATGNAERADEE